MGQKPSVTIEYTFDKDAQTVYNDLLAALKKPLANFTLENHNDGSKQIESGYYTPGCKWYDAQKLNVAANNSNGCTVTVFE